MGGRTVISDEEDELEEEEDGAVRGGKGALNLDEREDDDEEEEDEEGQDEYEKDDFIVDDVEEEEEEEEEKENTDEDRHRKKKKKKRESEKNFVLDEDDYELLQDNNITGFQRPKAGSKFKRLKKAGREEEQSGFFDDDESGKNRKGGRTAEEKLKHSLFGDDEGAHLEDIPEEEEQPEEEEDADIIGEEDEMADFIVDEEDVDENGAVTRKKKLKKKKTRQAPGVSSSALQEAHEIFGDVDELLLLRKQSMAKGANDSGGWLEKRLEDEFEPFILSEKYMTVKDDAIRETDIPERIQLLEDISGEPPTDDNSIEEESLWIYNQLASGNVLPSFGADQVKEINKEEIGNVLTMLHVQKLDIPFIAMYRKELCLSLLKDFELDMQDDEEKVAKMSWHKVLWAVQTLDKKWLLLQKRKTALQLYYSKRYEEEARRIDDETRLELNQQLFKSITDALKDAKSEREIDDVDAKFNLHFPPGEVDAEEGQFKRPKRKSLYSVCHKAGLWEVANKFGFNSEHFGLLLSLEKMRVEELEDGKETPEEVAANFTCAMFETPNDVLKGARHMAAVEIGCEPIVRKHVRSIFMENAVVSTSPTPEGNSTIDTYHQLSGVKWLRNKPLSKFEGAQWLLIQKAEEEKLLQVTIKLPEAVEQKLLSDANEFYLSECVSKSAQQWNDQRKMILEDSFKTYILPSMEKEARSLLTVRGKNWLLLEYGKELWNRVSVAPFHRKDADLDSEDDYEARVMACCWGPGKPATTMVMLDTAGEMVDVLYAGSISIRSQGVAEQQRKKNDQQRVLKFLTDHQPHAVCVGAANLSCRLLKDDIYEVIFKIVEDHPRDVSRDIENMAIIFGDESLPRLYENSRISSDQLPGQPGIVRRAVGLGRYLQNPLAMVATLCGSGKEILSWKLCPLEHFLTPDEKYEMVEQVMVDATNQVGLDINLAASHEWLFAPLQFISGLGPRKASALQKAFVRLGSIYNRKEIPMGKFLRKKVFINSAGFLRVRRSGAAASSSHIMDLLDDTRIHPESYDLAKNLAKDVYAEDAPQEPNEMDDDAQEMAIEHVRERPNMLKALDIDEYAKSILDRFGTRKRETLYDIKMELLHGFQDWRWPFKDPVAEQEFDMLCGETEETLSDGRIVQVTVRNLQDNRIVCAFDSGLKGLILADDFSDEGYDLDKVQIQEGDILTCKIKNVNKLRCVVYLTCKESELRRRQYYFRNRDPFYHEDETNMHNEQEKARKEKELAKKNFKPRMIVHPRFQNLTVDEAMEYLSDKDPGESIIRPSSKGPSFLTLTLKVYDGVYAHKDIAESGKDHKDITSLLRLGKTLTIDKDTFEDLDEVMDRYVDPLVSHLKNLLAYRKFRRGIKSEVDDLLRAEKAENPMRIVYCFGISHEHPGTFILSYIRSSNPHHEYIGLYPKGFRFRKRDFDDIDRLVNFFQKNIDKPPDAGPSLRTVAAMVPMKSPASGGDWGGPERSNNDWRSHSHSDRERSSTPGSRAGGRFGGRDGHPTGLPGPGRGRGRGRGSEGRDSDFGSSPWGAGRKDDDGFSNFPGAKVQNSPGREMFPGGWDNSGNSAAVSGWGGSSGGAGNDGGNWGGGRDGGGRWSGAGDAGRGRGGRGNTGRVIKDDGASWGDGGNGGAWGAGDSGGRGGGDTGGWGGSDTGGGGNTAGWGGTGSGGRESGGTGGGTSGGWGGGDSKDDGGSGGGWGGVGTGGGGSSGWGSAGGSGGGGHSGGGAGWGGDGAAKGFSGPDSGFGDGNSGWGGSKSLAQPQATEMKTGWSGSGSGGSGW